MCNLSKGMKRAAARERVSYLKEEEAESAGVMLVVDLITVSLDSSRVQQHWRDNE